MQYLKNNRHLTWNQLGCVLGVMSLIGPPGLDMMNKTRNRQHRGRRGVGIELLICYDERLGCQVYQQGGRVRVVRPWGPSLAESLWSYCTNDGGIDVGHKAFSWGDIIYLLGNPGRQLEVLLQWPHRLEGRRCIIRSCNQIVVGCVFLPHI